MSLNEGQLIKSAQAGDREAFSSLAEKFERRIYTLAFYYTRDPHDAEDLAQEVWLKAYGALGSFRGESSFYTWLRQITINTFLNSRRGETVRRSEPSLASALNESATREGLENLLAGCAEPIEDIYHRRLMVESVFRALGELTPQQRLIFLLKHREGMTYEEISRVLDCSIGTIKKALFRAILKLRQQLGIRPAPLEYAQCGAGQNG